MHKRNLYNMSDFYNFNPLKSTQIGSNADTSDDPPPPNPGILQNMTEGVSHLLGEGQQQCSTSQFNHYQETSLNKNHFTL